jgi:peptidyl-prolyl cis-trans isomerase B (cyclophilin B)
VKKDSKKGLIWGIIIAAVCILTCVIIAVAVSPKRKTYYVEMKIQDYGTVVMRLEGEVAPRTVHNFVKLAKRGFYDGLTFHRVIDDFMIQGGCPDGIGTGGSGRNIKGEFASNGFANTISHRRGVVSMARSDTPNSASSQFFICTADSTHLDGDYAAFGYVIEGMDVVDRVSDKSLAYTQGGVIKDKTKQPVIEYVRVLKDYTEK